MSKEKSKKKKKDEFKNIHELIVRDPKQKPTEERVEADLRQKPLHETDSSNEKPGKEVFASIETMILAAADVIRSKTRASQSTEES